MHLQNFQHILCKIYLYYILGQLLRCYSTECVSKEANLPLATLILLEKATP